MRTRACGKRAAAVSPRGVRALGALMLLMMTALTPVSAAAEERFPDQAWGADLLLLLSAGPYLLPPDLDLSVPPPPDAVETRAELDRLELYAALLRDDETRHLILREAEATPERLLADAGLIPEADRATALWPLLELTGRETAYFVLREKRAHARARPTQLRPRIGTTIAIPPHPAYPSGHSAQIHMAAGVLSALNPSCAETYRLFAAGVALRREVAGVHYPSDTRAGEILAEALLSRLLTHPALGDRLSAARRELIAHAGSAGCEGGRS